jgi:hypothetical protein
MNNKHRMQWEEGTVGNASQKGNKMHTHENSDVRSHRIPKCTCHACRSTLQTPHCYATLHRSSVNENQHNKSPACNNMKWMHRTNATGRMRVKGTNNVRRHRARTEQQGEKWAQRKEIENVNNASSYWISDTINGNKEVNNSKGMNIQ